MAVMLHKHIARHTKRYVGHVTKYLYERDTILATISVFVFLVLLGLIPINFYVLNPMKLALQDFDFNDVSYAKLGKGQDTVDKRIRIVNIGRYDREQIANLIDKISAMKPKVIGLDALFEGEKDPQKDSVLRNVFQKTKNLVAATYLIPGDTFNIRKDHFYNETSNTGYVNFVTETIGTRRIYTPFEEVNGSGYPSFTSALIHEFDTSAYKKLEKRKKTIETINYSRRVDKYWVIEGDAIMADEVSDNVIENKLVLLGYVNADQNDIEDKMFTPMNDKFAGKSYPDMNGIVVHANIISMVLDGNYIKKTPAWIAWLVAILIGWLHMSLFIRYYLESHIWFHLVAKLAQLFSVIFFAYLGILIFDEFRIKLDMKYTLYVIVLAVDVIYFYEALVTWMHKKYKYQTIFAHHHHPAEHAAGEHHLPKTN